MEEELVVAKVRANVRDKACFAWPVYEELQKSKVSTPARVPFIGGAKHRPTLSYPSDFSQLAALRQAQESRGRLAFLFSHRQECLCYLIP